MVTRFCVHVPERKCIYVKKLTFSLKYTNVSMYALKDENERKKEQAILKILFSLTMLS